LDGLFVIVGACIGSNGQQGGRFILISQLTDCLFAELTVTVTVDVIIIASNDGTSFIEGFDDITHITFMVFSSFASKGCIRIRGILEAVGGNGFFYFLEWVSRCDPVLSA
jgi:hypothetical protein